jgi:glyoxylase-like metal-dependent hydrolase (beta-lactamase superfamily II)
MAQAFASAAGIVHHTPLSSIDHDSYTVRSGDELATIEVTGALQHAAWAKRSLPPVERLREGAWSIPVPISSGTMRYTNVYAFASQDGLTLVDAGWDDETSWAALAGGLAETGHAVADVRRVLVTHAHRDHIGQAARVRRAAGALIVMHPLEAASLATLLRAGETRREEELAWMRRCGVPDDLAVGMLPTSIDFRLDLAEPDVLVNDGQLLSVPGWRLRALWTPGHTPGHLAFAEEDAGWLMSGDTLLPRISPHISADPTGDRNTLKEFLSTVDRLGTVTADEVLPAHEYRFRGLATRTVQLLAHHETRLAELVANVAEDGSTAWELATKNTWARPWSDMPPMLRRLAVSETLAHLDLLADRCVLNRIAFDDVELWSRK